MNKLRAFILATIVAFLAAPVFARGVEYTEAVCSSWAQVTMGAIVLWNNTSTVEEYRLAIEEILSEEEDVATVKTIRAIADFVEVNAGAGVSARTLVGTVYDACTEKLAKRTEV